LEKRRNRMGQDLNWHLCSAWKKWIGGTPSEHSPHSPDLARLIRFLGFSNHEKGAPRQEISKWSTVCSTFSRSGWNVVRSASLVKGGTSKKRPSPHLHNVLTQSNKASPWTLQTAFMYLKIVCTVRIVYVCTKLSSENLKGRDQAEDIGVDERIMLEWILGN
jgi:hypothetical protein